MFRTRRRWAVEALESRAVPAIVSNLSDFGPGSFRQALLDTSLAGATPADNAITFSPGLTGTILLQSPLPTIDDDLVITGPGAAAVTVKRDPLAGSFRILTVHNSAKLLDVSISGLTLTGGFNAAANQFDNGGGINIGSESVTLTGMAITGNTSNQEGGGIGVGKAGILTILNSTISGNTALGNSGASVSGGAGGGIYFAYDGQLTLRGSTVSGNVAANSGGGLYLYASSSANWLIQNSTLSGNRANGIIGGGGAIVMGTSASGTQTLTIQNSTIYQNSATGFIGSGGGIRAAGNSLTSLVSTIVSNNAASSGPDLSNTTAANKFTALNSAIFSTAGTNSFVNSGGNVLGKALLLAPLAFNNGGTTQTHLPAANSPVIDVGSNPAGLSTDQNGLARTFDDPTSTGAGIVDIGAVEVQPFGLPTAKAAAGDVTIGGGTSQTITVTYDDNTGIKVSTLGTGDIVVNGPGGFTATPTFQGVDIGSDGRPRVATYTFNAPGGAWDAADVGAYTVAAVANEVQDLAGNFVPAGAIGSFVCRVPRNFVVTNTNDAGPGSLRDAIALANDPAFAPSADSITFALAGPATITLASQLVVSDSVTITGLGAADLTLSGAGLVRHFVVDGPGTLVVGISGMTLVDGKTTGNSVVDRGGSVQVNDENLTLTDVVIQGASTNVRGGAVSLQGPAVFTFVGGRIQDSASGVSFVGGAISSDAPGHVIVLRDSVISGNSGGLGGGAIYSVGGSVTIERCNIVSNSATGDGGGLLLGNQVGSSGLTVIDSTFFNNRANGSGQGAAITVVGATPGVLIRNSTISGNSAGGTAAGGLLFGLLDGPVLIQNSTIAYNGALAASGMAIVPAGPNGIVVMQSTILAANVGDPAQPDLQGTVLAFHSLIGVIDGLGAVLDPASLNNISGIGGFPADPLLEPIGLNGGTTLTHELKLGSPAIDFGINPAGLANDQRGTGFPRFAGAGVDIGAFERVSATTPAKVTAVTVNGGAAQRSRVLSVEVTFDNPLNLPMNPADAFELKRNSDNAAVALSATASGNTVTLTFTGGPVQAGSLLDGRYTLTILAAQSSNLDGNGDGTAGDDYTLVGTPANGLFRLFGDADGSGQVDAADFLAFRLAFLGNSPVFDVAGDGFVDPSDFLAFRLNFLKVI